MKQSQKRHFRNAGCDCRDCLKDGAWWGWLAAIVTLAAVAVIAVGVVVMKG